MADDVLVNKAATIERCVRRVREEYVQNPATFPMDLTRQDAAILNIQRACEAALDMGKHVIRREKLGVPPKCARCFHAAGTGRLDRYSACQQTQTHLDEFLEYSHALVLGDASQTKE